MHTLCSFLKLGYIQHKILLATAVIEVIDLTIFIKRVIPRVLAPLFNSYQSSAFNTISVFLYRDPLYIASDYCP